MADQERARGWRLRLGAAIFVLSFFSPALIPLVTSSGLSMEWKTTFSGLLAFGIPELGAIIAVAIMGKTGFEMMKESLPGRAETFSSGGTGESDALVSA